MILSRFNMRRWGKVSVIVVLSINLFSISSLYFLKIPHRWDWRIPDRLHRLRADGRLEVNMNGRHPIPELIALGEAKWTEMMQRYVLFTIPPTGMRPKILSSDKARLFRKPWLNITDATDGTHPRDLTTGMFALLK